MRLGLMLLGLLAVAGAARGEAFELVLDKAVDGKPLTVFVEGSGGKGGAAVGTARSFNRMPHDVDASGLTIDGGTLKGPLKVTVQPDLWIPKDRKPVPCVFEVDAKRAGEKVEGTFSGTYGKAAAAGAVTGRAVTSVTEGPVELTLEDALPGGSRNKGGTRAVVRFNLKGGKGEGVGLESQASVTLTASDVVVEAGKLRGELKLSAGEKAYTLKLTGQVVGTGAAGAFDLEGADKPRKGKWVGSVGAAKPG